MAQRTSGLRSVLSLPAAYQLFTQIVGSPAVWHEFIDNHVRSKAGDRVLDIGCGPGDILEFLPDVTYVGVDLSPLYIASATKKFGDRGTFSVSGIDDLDASRLGVFDIAIAKSVLHHLDDSQASKLFEVVSHILAPGGRLVTLDAGFAEGQSALSRYVVGKDRGANVRTDSHYVALAKEWFDEVEVTVHHHLLRMPYTHVLLDCASPRRVG
ncbi:MAG: class I SAM-dependent methyltransferase [Actinomycetes bacterium]